MNTQGVPPLVKRVRTTIMYQEEYSYNTTERKIYAIEPNIKNLI